MAVTEAGRREDVRVLVLTGGDRDFCCGVDLNEMASRTPLEAQTVYAQEVITRVSTCSKPVIGAIHGYALGGGCELTLACDVRIGDTSCRMGFPEVGLGIIPSGGGTQRLASIVGARKARELILTGRVIDAREAVAIGLLNTLTEPNQLWQVVENLCQTLMSKAPLALQLAKVAMIHAAGWADPTGLTIERLYQAVLMGTEDKKEGSTSFIRKTKPSFIGR